MSGNGGWDSAQEGQYGDVPLLKRPVWGWEIVLYFFLGGAAGSATTLASLARLLGRSRSDPIVRWGTYCGIASLAAFPPLLIKDLGRPMRFLHMLRVFKPYSPMNAGTWALTGLAALQAPILLKQLAADVGAGRSIGSRLIPDRLLAGMSLPLAAFASFYTGVLLAVTSIPVWTKSKLLGGVFAASAAASGTAMVSAATNLAGDGSGQVNETLATIELGAALAEGLTLAAYLNQSGEAGKPITENKDVLYGGIVAAGLVFPGLIRLSGLSRRSRVAALTADAMTLGGALLLRSTIVYAGRRSAADRGAYMEYTKAG